MKSSRNFLCFLCSLFLCLLIVTPFLASHLFPSTLIVKNLATLQRNGIIATTFSLQNDRQNENLKQGIMKVNFLGINIKNVKLLKIENDEIYACGKTVGVALQTKGVVVIGQNPILTNQGKFQACSSIELGDILCEIEGEPIENAEQINDIINQEQFKGKELVVKLKRKNEYKFITLKPIYDIQSKTYKLGLWVRDDASGIGTVTYIKTDTHQFGALGHPISDIDTGAMLDIRNGNIYKCNILSLQKATHGRAGEMKGIFIQSQKDLGVVTQNNENGIYGIANEELLNQSKKVKIGGRATAKAGKATILCSLDGKKIEEFSIEIIKNNIKKKSNKSLVFKVIDKNLIERTGGIIQGMSGSPIIQNGRLIGAVTHVFVNDSTKGFGIYLDSMLENS